MEIENLFNEWSIAYRAKGGKITVSSEELFADFFRWLKSKAAEQSVQSDGDCPYCKYPSFDEGGKLLDHCAACSRPPAANASPLGGHVEESR